MNKKKLFLTALFLVQPLLFNSAASADIDDVKAEWDQGKQKLSVEAKDEHNKRALSVVYNDQQYAMTYNKEKERYELKLLRICYDDSVLIVSSSGETKRKSVRTKNGDGSGYECTEAPPVNKDVDGDGYKAAIYGGQDCNDTDAFIFPGATEICGDNIDQDCSGADLACAPPVDIDDVKAAWDQRKQKLSVKVKDELNKRALSVVYNDQQYAMTYNKEKERYELKLRRICYDDSVLIVSSSGETKRKSVRTKNGDGSGYECTEAPPVNKDVDGDGYKAAIYGGQDCNDSDALIFPGATEICGDNIDQDCSGADLACAPPVNEDVDGDGYKAATYGGQDCNDSDALIFPGATEICGDNIDQDCSGADLACAPPVNEDVDGDGYKAAIYGGQDCNDSDALIFPGATETCGDNIDQDCNGADLACEPPVNEDVDGDGYKAAIYGGQDCNDSDALIFPGATETCGDNIDQDCNGADLACEPPVNEDVDGDGYKAAIYGGQDCNDSDALIFPGATEICGDNIDQDCSGADLACEPPVNEDVDGDGYKAAIYGGQDCNDSDALIFPGATEICGDNIDQDCSGADLACEPPVNEDVDGDGYKAAIYGGQDCNDSDALIFPGATEICGDNIDQDCNGADLACETNDTPHGGLTFAQYPSNCLSCHYTEAIEMQSSTHYQWVGEAPDMVNNTGTLQGKLTNAINSYCINIKGDWPVCGSCHVGRGKQPDDPTAGLENIDCLVCHSEEYSTSRTRLADGSMGVLAPTDSMVRNIQAPTRTICLSCHAKAGGGDAVKRGDISLATAHNNDPDFDVHMNTNGSDLSCQECHVFENHLVIGKGSDLRATDDLSRGAEISCTTCHTNKDSLSGHASSTISQHAARVACQTCHIPIYAKVATETYRDWQITKDGVPADGSTGPAHPYTFKEANLVPEYRFWNRQSDNYLLGDDASLIYDAARGTYPTSSPIGDVEEGKIYPFKYKKANQPMTTTDSRLIALDTFEYLKASGDVDLAVKKGLVNMDYSADEPYAWVETDTYQLLNHGISPSSGALQCSNCHENTSRMDLQGELGYQLKGARGVVCLQCHKDEGNKSFTKIHEKHVNSKKYDCSWCHEFSRPERNLRMP